MPTSDNRDWPHASYESIGLRLSKQASIAFDLRGRPILVNEVFPYRQSITESERLLLSVFSPRRQIDAVAATRQLRRLLPNPLNLSESRIRRMIVKFVRQGILTTKDTDLGIYPIESAVHYEVGREVPATVAAAIAKKSAMSNKTKILDLCTGTGSLAIQFARISDRVTGVDLSSSLLRVARRNARKEGVRLKLVEESGNRLIHSADRYDVITICQAFHFLDHLIVARAIDQALEPNGLVVFVESRINFPASHKLPRFVSSLLRVRSPRTHDIRHADFKRVCARECEQLLTRYERLFAALRHPTLPTASQSGLSMRREDYQVVATKQLVGIDWARAFFTRARIANTGLSIPEFWRLLDRAFETADPNDLVADCYWLVITLKKENRMRLK